MNPRPADSNPYAENARLNKAIKLADYIEGQTPETIRRDAPDFSNLKAMGAEWWKDIASLAKVNPPSEATIETVCDLLRQRVNAADPFADLGTVRRRRWDVGPMNRDRDFTTEAEMGEDIAGFFVTFNTENWMSNLRYYAEQAGWDSQIGCLHGRGAPNDRARAAHAERGIDIPATYFCFDCGAVIDAADWVQRVHPPAPEQNFRDMATDTDVVIVGSGGRSFLANLDPNRVDYVTPEGVEVWMERKGNSQKTRFLDAFGNQVGPTHKNLVPAIVYATLHGWRDPSSPDWWNDEVYEQTKASAAGELDAWEGGWVDRPEAWVK